MPLLPPDRTRESNQPLDAGGEEIVERFEAAWRSGESEPPIREYLDGSASDAALRYRLLLELVLIDVEYRWRRSESDGEIRPWPLDDYASEFLELWPVELIPMEIIAEEYRARSRWGDRPSHARYLRLFPGREADLHRALQAVDAALRRERADEPATVGSGVDAAQSPLRDSQVLLSDRDIILQSHVGTGGIGRVYRAWLKATRETIAIKILRKASQNDPRAIERFLKEAETLALLQHPAIVRLRHVGRMRNGIIFFVMDFVAGEDLSAILARGPIGWRQAAGWVRDAAEAIRHAHARGIVHCDLKPGNLLLDDAGRVRVTDFGLAARIHTGGDIDRGTGGTLGYMAPEQLDPDWGPIGPQTDVFGLGALLAALLLGRPPCPGVSAAEVLAATLERRHLAVLDSLRGKVPSELIETCRRSMTPSITERMNSAEVVCRDLSRILSTNGPP